jgi:DNA mismatch endonuclease Vsr
VLCGFVSLWLNPGVRDRLTKERRSWNMGRIRGKNTSPEIIVRKLLHRMGYRFGLHVANLPGKPDIVLPKLIRQPVIAVLTILRRMSFSAR